MIDRYTHPEMGNIWTLENEFRTMLKVEILACEAMNKLGIVPDDALKDIQTKSDFRLDRIKEIEAVTNHDVIAFLTNVAEYVGDASKYIHKGLTSSDVKDTALCYIPYNPLISSCAIWKTSTLSCAVVLLNSSTP